MTLAMRQSLDALEVAHGVHGGNGEHMSICLFVLVGFSASEGRYSTPLPNVH